ncbi:MAG: helix-turn-helix domain-containing protein [Acidimicrobiia bacterium]|nr:helix-turn-helix domain-containing protein [Acidimicrobiia bacterium]
MANDDGAGTVADADHVEPSGHRLDVFKALGDNTRYAIYLELARAPRPLSTAEVAASLDLHVNTVRPHLERMRDIGLLELSVDARGDVGRPQHRYALAEDAPSLGLEPPVFPLATRLLLRVAAQAGASREDAVEIGREQGRQDGSAGAGSRSACVDAVMARLATLGFDPALIEWPRRDRATVAFGHCPFRDLAESNPDLVCGLHQGLMEGFVARHGGGTVAGFRTLVDRDPCAMDLVGIDEAEVVAP